MKGLVPTAKNIDAAEMNQALARLLSHIQELAASSEAVLAKAKLAKAGVLKRTRAKEKTEYAAALFKRYDKDHDGLLSRIEVQGLSKGEFGLRLPNRTMEMIWRNLVPEGSKGVPAQAFQRLRVYIGCAREIARDDQRKLVTAEKLKVLERVRAGLAEKLKELSAMCEDANLAVCELESRV